MSRPYFSNAVFPDNLAPKAVKDTKTYGQQVAQAILASTKEYREKMREVFGTCRKYVDAKQSLKEYLDELDIDGQKMYANISYKPRPIIQKFMKVIVDGYMEKNEYPDVKATSKHIQDRKDKKIADAEFRMKYGAAISQLSQESQVELENPKDFTPKSIEDLNIYATLNDKEREELLMQELVSFALKDNNIKEKKQAFLAETFVTSLFGYYSHINEEGRLDVVGIQGEDAIMDSSHKSIMTDVGYAGHFIRMKVCDIRNEFALSPMVENELFGCAKAANGKYGNTSLTLNWREDYRFSDLRPYDNMTVELYHVWYKTNKVIGTVDGVDENGKPYQKSTYDYDSEAWKRQASTTTKVSTKFPVTAYEGYFLAGTNTCLEWGEQRNVLKKGLDKEKLLCPYIYSMPYNFGRMETPSSVSMIIDSVRNMDVAILKIKQIIAQMTPDDVSIDLESLMELDLGDGELEPLDIITIYKQTGTLFYRGKDEDGNPNQAPIRQNMSSVGDKLNALIAWYNEELKNIKEYLGVNDFRDGSATSARTGFRFQQAQLEASNTATVFLYNAYLDATQELIKHIGIRIWDTLLYGTVNEGYLKYIGKENIEFIQSRKEITSSSYDIEFSMGMSDSDKANLEAKVNLALQSGNLELPDALLLEDIEDPKKAYKMLSYLYTKRRREKMEEAQANQKSAAEYSAQAGVAVEEAKGKTAQTMAQAEMAKEQERGRNSQLLAYQNTAMSLILEAFKTGKEIPETLMPLVDMALQNVQLKTQDDTEQTAKQIEAEKQAEQQQQLVQQLQQAVENGEITPEEAQQIASQNGLA